MDIREIILEIVKDKFEDAFGIVCTVTAVDGTTCTCSPIDDSADIEDVRLQAQTGNGILLVPPVGSKVVVQMINDVEGVVVMYSELESIKFLDGSFGGLIKINDLVTKINAIQTDINNLKSAFNSWVTVPNDGGAALKTAAASWSGSNLPTLNVNDIQNDKITHGTV